MSKDENVLERMSYINNKGNNKYINKRKSLISILFGFWSLSRHTRPHSAVGNVSGNRCESDCRSRGREFDPSPVPYFRGD